MRSGAPGGRLASLKGQTLNNRSEGFAARKARLEVVPVLHRVLPLLPAEVDLLAVADRWKVDKTAVEVAQDEARFSEVAKEPANFEESFADRPAVLSAAVCRRRVGHRLVGLAATEAVAGGAKLVEPRADPVECGVGLFDREMALVVHSEDGSAGGGAPSAGSAPRRPMRLMRLAPRRRGCRVKPISASGSSICSIASSSTSTLAPSPSTPLRIRLTSCSIEVTRFSMDVKTRTSSGMRRTLSAIVRTSAIAPPRAFCAPSREPMPGRPPLSLCPSLATGAETLNHTGDGGLKPGSWPAAQGERRPAPRRPPRRRQGPRARPRGRARAGASPAGI